MTTRHAKSEMSKSGLVKACVVVVLLAWMPAAAVAETALPGRAAAGIEAQGPDWTTGPTSGTTFQLR